MEHCNDCDNYVRELDRRDDTIAGLEERLDRVGHAASLRLRLVDEQAEKIKELDARLSNAMAATSAAVDSRAAMAETVDRLRQRLAEATGQLATVRQWMAEHRYDAPHAETIIGELSTSLLWSDADTAQGEELDHATRITALEKELVRLGDKVQRAISALQAEGPLRGFKP